MPKAEAVSLDKPQYTNEQLLKVISQLESSSGRNDKCVRKGLGYNGYGWGQSLTKDNCYQDREQVRAKVNEWLGKRFAEGMSVAQALCYYNQGKPSGKLLDDCKYHQDALTILN